MTTTQKAVIAALVVALGATALLVLAKRDGGGDTGNGGSSAGDTTGEARVGGDDATERIRVAPPAAGAVAAATDPGAAPTADEPRRDWPILVTTNVPGADVTLTFRCCGGGADPEAVTKRADDAGRAGFDLPADAAALVETEARAVAPGHAPGTERVQDGRAEIVLEPGFAVRGRVASARGGPLAQAAVELVGGTWANTDEHGAFAVYAPAAGAAALRVDHSAHRAAEVAAEAPSDDVRIVLDPGLSVRGRVTFPDLRPVPGATLQVGSVHALAEADDDGHYVLSGLPEGDVDVWCITSGETRSVAAGASGVDFVVRRTVVRAHLRDEDGRPFRRAAVWARTLHDGVEVASSGGGSPADGIVSFRARAGDVLQISPAAPGHVERITEVVVDGEPGLRDVEIVVPRAGAGATLALRVVDGAGAPVRRAFVTLVNAADSDVAGFADREVELDTEGRAALPGVPPGAHRLTVSTSRDRIPDEDFGLRFDATVHAEEGGEIDVVATVHAGGRLVVTLLDARGDVAAPAGRLQLLDADGESVAGMFWQRTEQRGWTTPPRTAAAAHFGPALGAGRYRVRYEAREGTPGTPVECDVVIVVGREVGVELRLAE